MTTGEESAASLWETASAWAEAHPGVLWGAFTGSILLLLASAALVPFVVGRLPVDEFAHRRAPRHAWHLGHPLLAVAWRVVRNALGAAFVLAGIAMLVLPGQGLLTIFVGVMLLEFPGKRALVLQVVRRKTARRTLNWLRRKRGVPEFEFDGLD